VRMRKVLRLLFVFVLVRGSTAQVPNLPAVLVPDSVRTEIVAALEAYYDALSDRDWERFQRHFWPGATITALWARSGESDASVHVQSVAEFVAAAPEGPDSRETFEERMTSADVQVRGAIATVFTQYRARFGDPGNISEWEGVDSFVLMKDDGDWRIVALTFVPGL